MMVVASSLAKVQEERREDVANVHVRSNEILGTTDLFSFQRLLLNWLKQCVCLSVIVSDPFQVSFCLRLCCFY